MKHMVDKGTLPLTEENDDDWTRTWRRMNWRGRIAQADYGYAKNWRVSKWARAQGPDEIESALVSGFCGIVGRQGHCVPYLGLTIDQGKPYAAYANSWGTRWGDRGIGYDSYRVYRNLTLWLALEVVIPYYVGLPKLA